MSTITQNELLAKIPLVQLEAEIEQFGEPVSKRLPDQRLKQVVGLAVRGISAAQCPTSPRWLALCNGARRACGR